MFVGRGLGNQHVTRSVLDEVMRANIGHDLRTGKNFDMKLILDLLDLLQYLLDRVELERSCRLSYLCVQVLVHDGRYCRAGLMWFRPGTASRNALMANVSERASNTFWGLAGFMYTSSPPEIMSTGVWGLGSRKVHWESVPTGIDWRRAPGKRLD